MSKRQQRQKTTRTIPMEQEPTQPEVTEEQMSEEVQAEVVEQDNAPDVQGEEVQESTPEESVASAPTISKQLTAFNVYVEAMSPARPQNATTLLTNQLSLFSAIEATILNEDAHQGASDLNEMLNVIANTENGTFSDNYVFRASNEVAAKLGDDRFEILVASLKVIAEPRRTGRPIRVPVADLCKRLPVDLGDSLLRITKVITG